MQAEADWIASLKAQAQSQSTARDRFSHDAFYDPSTRQIITADTLTDGIHFRSDWASPEDIGWKAVVVNYSDIAATGGQPEWVVVCLSLPSSSPHIDEHFVDALYTGIQAAITQYGGTLIGGDTTRGEQLSISITALGRLASIATPGRRNTAEPGQKLVISPPCHGLASVGLWALEHDQANTFPEAVSAYHRPKPQLQTMQTLALSRGKQGKHLCSMDTSDGLADAAIQLARESGCDIIIDPALLPTHDELNAFETESGLSALEQQLYGGDDFGVLYTCDANEENGENEEETLSKSGSTQTIIGRIRNAKNPGSGEAYLLQDGEETLLSPEKCYQHFTPQHQHTY